MSIGQTDDLVAPSPSQGPATPPAGRPAAGHRSTRPRDTAASPRFAPRAVLRLPRGRSTPIFRTWSGNTCRPSVTIKPYPADVASTQRSSGAPISTDLKLDPSGGLSRPDSGSPRPRAVGSVCAGRLYALPVLSRNTASWLLRPCTAASSLSPGTVVQRCGIHLVSLGRPHPAVFGQHHGGRGRWPPDPTRRSPVRLPVRRFAYGARRRALRPAPKVPP